MFDESMIIAVAPHPSVLFTPSGPDHYLPLVAMAKTNGWSATRPQVRCGLRDNHLLGTILIGSWFSSGLRFLNIETVQA